MIELLKKPDDVEVRNFFFLFPRPLWVEFPNELETFSVEDEYMLGEHFWINFTYEKYYNYVFLIIFSSIGALKNP